MTDSATAQIQGLTIVLVNEYKLPAKVDESIIIPSFGNMVFTHTEINGDSVSVTEKGIPAQLTTAYKNVAKEKAKLFPELEYLKNGYTLELKKGMQVVNDELTYLVTVTTPTGMKVKNYYDSKTGLKLRQQIDSPGNGATDIGDYRTLSNGVLLPYSISSEIFGQPVDLKVKSVTVE